MVMNRELYDAIKDVVGEEGARILAEQIPPRDEVATRSDVMDLETSIGDLETSVRDLGVRMDRFEDAMRAGFAQMRAEWRGDLMELKADTRQWMLSYFVPLWIGVYGTLGAVVVGIVLGR